jgi:predicted DCC family thiol-disulfide oxidoreductase YuxK
MRYHQPTRSAQAPGRHVIVYDGGCPFCRLSAHLIARSAREPVEMLTFEEAPPRGMLGELDEREVVASAHYVTPEGVEYHGGESMTRSLRLVPGGRLVGVLDRGPMRRVRDALYAAVSRLRPVLSPIVARFWRG